MRESGHASQYGAFLRAGIEEALGHDYEVLDELGQGGMAVVFRGRRRSDGATVALKVLRSEHIRDPDTLARFRREAELTLTLKHPAIVQTFAVMDFPPQGMVLALEYMSGGTLKAYLARAGALSPGEVESVLRSIASALGFAHARGIVHRDVKPDNIFLDAHSGLAKLGDFGIARGAGTDTLTVHGTVIGTPAYMSPEQIEGHAVGPASDFYSLGMVAWHLLTGRQPWEGDSMAAIVRRQLMDTLPPVAAFRPDVPPSLQWLLHLCLRKSPQERPQSAEEVLAIIDGVVMPATAGQSGTPATPNNTILFQAPPPEAIPALPPVPPRATRVRGRMPLWAPAALAALLLATVALVYQFSSHQPRPAPAASGGGGSVVRPSRPGQDNGSGPVARRLSEAEATQGSAAPGEVPVGQLPRTGATGPALDQFVLIPPGSFDMGSPQGQDDEQPVRRVSISRPFYLQRTEVTQAQWFSVMGFNPSRFQPCGPTCPVENVSWEDIAEFIRRINAANPGMHYRLPTEAEWEYAARGGASADLPRLAYQTAWFNENSQGHTQPVAQRDANAFGLYDMQGNVWEWVQDWYSPTAYATGPSTDPTGPVTGTHRVLRGGSWSSGERYIRVTARNPVMPSIRYHGYGFRLALTP